MGCIGYTGEFAGKRGNAPQLFHQLCVLGANAFPRRLAVSKGVAHEGTQILRDRSRLPSKFLLNVAEPNRSALEAGKDEMLGQLSARFL